MRAYPQVGEGRREQAGCDGTSADSGRSGGVEGGRRPQRANVQEPGGEEEDPAICSALWLVPRGASRELTSKRRSPSCSGRTESWTAAATAGRLAQVPLQGYSRGR